MSKRERMICFACQGKISPAALCERCGQPTPLASHSERVAWEVEQWSRSRGTAPRARAAASSPGPAPIAHAAALVTVPPAERPPAPDAGPETAPRAQRFRLHVGLPRRAGRSPGVPTVHGDPVAPQGPRSNSIAVAPVAGSSIAVDDRPVEEAAARGDPAERPLDLFPARRIRKGKEKPAAPARGAKAEGKTAVERPARATARARGLGYVEGETVLLSARGWSGFRPATLEMTRYRVALIGRRGRRARWIPLDEVAEVSTAWRGAPTLIVEGSVEIIAFQHRVRRTLAVTTEALLKAVRGASKAGNGHRHHDVTAAWWELAERLQRSPMRALLLEVRRRDAIVAGLWLSPLPLIAALIARFV